MGRYLKYLEIVNTIDETLKKKTAGKVDMDKDLPKIKSMLEVQKLALEMSMCIDRIDDNVKSSFKLYAKGDPSARGVVEEVLEKMKESGAGGESASGRDFRRGRENPESDGGYPARSRLSEGRADARGAHGEMNRHEEEDRRRRRSRSEWDHYGEEEENNGGGQALFDRFNEEDRRGRSRRTGRFVHRAEMEEDPRDFWPLTYPGFPFGMARGGFGADEQSRMGFLGNGMSGNAPYNHMPIPDPLKNLPFATQRADGLVGPLIKSPNSMQADGGHEAGEDSADADATTKGAAASAAAR